MKPEWIDDFKVEDDGGPASDLRSEEASRYASSIVERAMPAAGSVGLWRAKTFLVLSGVAGALTVLGASYVAWQRAPRTEQVPNTPRVAVSVVPPSEPGSPPATETVSIADLPNVVAAPAPAAPTARSATPADLLAEANRARSTGEWTRAAGLYDRVVRAQTDESYPAMIALASLRREHFDDPQGALALYERALATRPNGTLTEQAQAGVARCRQALVNAPATP